MQHIEPVTVSVTLTGRKAAAFRRMCRYDEQTEQEAAETAIIGVVDAFIEMEAIHRQERKEKAAGITRPQPFMSPEFAGSLSGTIAGMIANRLEEAGLELVPVGGAR